MSVSSPTPFVKKVSTRIADTPQCPNIRIRSCSGLPEVVVQQSSKSFPSVDFSSDRKSGHLGSDELVGQTLVVPFLIVVDHKLLQRPPQDCLGDLSACEGDLNRISGRPSAGAKPARCSGSLSWRIDPVLYAPAACLWWPNVDVEGTALLPLPPSRAVDKTSNQCQNTI
jgi:hypothetical protein